MILSYLHKINPFRTITIEDDINQRITMTHSIIQQSNATIRRAEYLKHMALHESQAALEWVKSERSKSNDSSN